MEYTRTEVHTHLLGMLRVDDFIELIKDYTDYIYWPLIPDGCERLVSVDELKESEDFFDSLRIKSGKTASDYNKNLGDFYEMRNMLINFLVSVEFLRRKSKDLSFNDLVEAANINSNIDLSVIEYVQKEMKKAENRQIVNNIRIDILSNYFNRCLEELINDGVKYTEISYSNAKMISSINIKKDLENKITVKFLLSTDRSKNVNSFIRTGKDLKRGLEGKRIIGFDIMGNEELIDIEKEEKEYNRANISISQAKKTFSLKYKLEKLVDVFMESNNKNCVLRIHSGETKNSMGNTEWVLETLKEIKDKIKKENSMIEILPPPQLRIGHAIRFNPDNERYAELLKEFDASVEFNISSNLALGNIDSIEELPFKYYSEHNIPIILSTDGSGLYDTCIKKENLIARKVLSSSEFNSIVENDRKRVMRHR